MFYFMRMNRILATMLLMLVSTTSLWADAVIGVPTVTREEVSLQVPFTYKTDSKTLQVAVRYVLTAKQNPNTLYDHTVLPIPYSDLSAMLGTTVTKSNVNNMLYFPLAGDGTYGHNNDNWYDKNGYRSSWGGQSWWFIQPVTDDDTNLIIWTGQAGVYNNAYTSKIGDTYHTVFYAVNGTNAVEMDLTLNVVGSDEEAPEWVHVVSADGLQNIRDLGGWTTASGETVQYGKLFRGCELQGEKYTASAAALQTLHDEVGIRAELDLRTHAQALNIKVSPLGSDVDYLRVVNEPYYLDGVRTAWANYRSDFDFILKNLRVGNPVYFHCIWGADRTGTLALMLEGLLGLSEEDLYQEYELTALSFPEGETRTKALVEPIVTYVKTFDGETLQQKFINYWHQHAHVALDDLNEFIQIMLGTTTDYVADLPEALDNLAYDATELEASFTHATTSLYTVNDGIIGFGELPENKHWNTWDPNRTRDHWLRYGWNKPQTVERVRVAWWTDSDVPGDHVVLPASWKVQYWDEENSTWKDVTLLAGEAYTQSRTEVSSVRFEPVETKQLRLFIQAQGNGSAYSGVGVTEWEALGHRTEVAVTYGDYPIQNVDFARVHLTDQFWQPRMKQNQTVTIPFAIEQCYNSNRVLNFQKAAAILRGENIGYFDTECTFDDTDIYKILEGMAYSVQVKPNEQISAKMDELIAIVGAAQEPDGYLYTPRTAGNPAGMHGWVGQNRWEKDPDLSHELYNAGHLYEAAYAHYVSTGKTSLLDIATKNADLLVHDFLEGGLTYEPGHQIVEMGLVKLYRATGKEDYLRLAKYFLDLRGGRGVMRQEYSQTHKPVVMQDEAVGHAVRAAYMYSGMADVAAIMGDEAYLSAIDKIWSNVAEKKFYINGGIGARHAGEAFGANYELPNKEAYCETCAAIANVYWNWRMFLLHGESKYYDVLERSLYNGVISGINLDGNRFFYPNPLASDGNGYNGRSAEREPWFGCACCPSNLCRFIASVPGYVYAHKDDKVYVNLYMQGTADIDLGSHGTLHLTQTTDYPWNGDIRLGFNVEDLTEKNLTLMLRLPGWAKGEPVPSDLYSYVDGTHADIVVSVNGTPVEYTMQDGYMTINRTWSEGDEVTFSLPMPVQHVIANDAVAADQGLVALERGPIVYCMEGIDNPDNFYALICNDEAEATVTDASIASYTFKGINVAGQVKQGQATADATLTLVPYYAWNNRGRGYMQVWMPRTSDKATFEAYPVVVSKSDLDIVHTQDINIDYYPVSDGWAQHNVSGMSAGGDVPTLLQLPISQFSLDMMYAPLDDENISRTKNASDAKGFWFENADGTPGTLYNQPTWNEATARIFLNIEGFYIDGGTLKLGHGQRPNACRAGTYVCTVYMLTPSDGEGRHRACQFNFHINLHPSTLDESADYSVERPNITAARLIRTLKADKHNTLVLPFVLTAAQAEQVFGPGSVLEQITDYDGEAGLLNTETLSSTTAHVPFLLVPTTLSSDNTYDFSGILTTNGTPVAATFTGGTMTGSYAAATTVSRSTMAGRENYVISDGAFYLVGDESGTMKGTRAYLTLETPSGSEAKLVVHFEGEATGIQTVTTDEAQGLIYDLSGRLVSTPTKGMYIVNGQKVLCK